MNLSKYDKKLVRITDKFNDIYEGICYYNSFEYNEHEYGVNEDSLEILQFSFYESIIKKVEEIDSIDKYGYIEKLIIEDDIDFIEDVLYSEEEENIYRLLLCIEEVFNSKLTNPALFILLSLPKTITFLYSHFFP